MNWPSQTKQRKLVHDLEPLGKALLRGTWQDIARAAFKVKNLKIELLKCSLKEISKECSGMVSTANPSILRKTSVTDMRKLSLKDVCLELKEKAPFLYSVLVTCAIPKGNKTNAQWLPSVAVAASILLKERSKFMTAVQILMTILMKYNGFQVSTSKKVNCLLTLCFPMGLLSLYSCELG